MDITLQKIDEVSSKLTLKIVAADYAENVKKTLKKMKADAKMPGFRPGMVPMGLIQKMYGVEVKAREVEKFVSESIDNYVKEQQLNLMIHPIRTEGQALIDIEKDDDFEMSFDLALEPAIDFTLTAKDELPYKKVEVADAEITEQIENLRLRKSSYNEVDTFSADDFLKGTLTELDENGAVKENGLVVEDATLMPKYFKGEDSKKAFEGAKKDGTVQINVQEMYEGNEVQISSLLKIKKEESVNYSKFQYAIKSITHAQPAELNQEFYDSAFGADKVHNEDECKAAVKASLEQKYAEESDFQLMKSFKDYAMQKVGDVKFAEDILKRNLIAEAKEGEKEEDIVAKFPAYLEDCKWSLITNSLFKSLKLDINEDKMKEAAKAHAKRMFAYYGSDFVDDALVERYAENILKDEKQMDQLFQSALTEEFLKAIKATATLKEQIVTKEELRA